MEFVVVNKSRAGALLVGTPRGSLMSVAMGVRYGQAQHFSEIDA
jgi:hypothetical protein